MASAMRTALRVGAFVTIGMIIGATLQLEFIGRLEDSESASLISRSKFFIQPWHVLTDFSTSYDKEATALRLGYVKPEILSWSPRIILFHNFLSIEECDHLRAIALPRLKNSAVVDRRTGKGVPSTSRTSAGMVLSPKDSKHPIVESIEKRISVFSQVPVENGESIQVLRYEVGQQYRPHNDYFSDEFNIVRGGQRVATMLMYLSDNVEGGETVFPRAGTDNCSCGGDIMKGLSVKPDKGNAVLFWSMGLDGESDTKSVHGGCPVVSGEKWSATKWMRQKSRTLDKQIKKSEAQGATSLGLIKIEKLTLRE